MSDQNHAPAAPQDDNQLIAERREKLRALREVQAGGGAVAFPNNFKPTHRAAQLHLEFGEVTNEVLEATPVSVRVAGRMHTVTAPGGFDAARAARNRAGNRERRVRRGRVIRLSVTDSPYQIFRRD